MSLHDLVGFDYPQTIRKLNQRFTYEQIARLIGYENKASIHMLLTGTVPSHPHGEALWALYVNTFTSKPPLTNHQNKQMILHNHPSGP